MTQLEQQLMDLCESLASQHKTEMQQLQQQVEGLQGQLRQQDEQVLGLNNRLDDLMLLLQQEFQQ